MRKEGHLLQGGLRIKLRKLGTNLEPIWNQFGTGLQLSSN